MLNFHALSDAAYNALRYNILINVEETGNPKSLAYLDSKGIPTIGIGFNLRDKAVRDAVLQSFGFDTSASDTTNPVEWGYIKEIITIVNGSNASKEILCTKLNDVMQRRFYDDRIPTNNKTRPDFQFLNDNEIRSVYDVLIEKYETSVNSWLPGIGKSSERATLVSLAWNNAGTLLGNNLRNAIQSGDRAEAWYEIRYGSNGDKLPGIAKRRYYESEVFGLYAPNVTASNISDKDARNVLRMYSKHRTTINDYEMKYGQGGTSGDQVAAANRDYGLTGDAAVDTIYEALQPARTYLINEYVTKKGLSAVIDGDILVAYAASAAGQGFAGLDSLTGGAKNDLVLGEDGIDIVDGGAGSDSLFGGSGNDTLTGGVGNDYLEGGAGLDHLEGGAGNDTYLFNRGDGVDTIYNYDTTAGKQDTIRFGAGIAPSNITLQYCNGYRGTSGLWLEINGTSDALCIKDWNFGDAFHIEHIEFADGTIWDAAYIQSRIIGPTAMGSGGNDILI